MTLSRMHSLALAAALSMASAAAQANLYGYVEGGRVSVVISDTQPDDARYTLYRKGRPASPAASESAASGDAPLPARFSDHVLAAARETSVDPALISAVISVESGYNPAARSPAGAVGLMQLMPGTALRYGVKNRLDPAQNIRGGARYLRDLKTMFGDNLQLVLAAYNAGEEAVIRYGMRIPPFRETAAYVPKVLGYYGRLRTSPPSASAE